MKKISMILLSSCALCITSAFKPCKPTTITAIKNKSAHPIRFAFMIWNCKNSNSFTPTIWNTDKKKFIKLSYLIELEPEQSMSLNTELPNALNTFAANVPFDTTVNIFPLYLCVKTKRIVTKRFKKKSPLRSSQGNISNQDYQEQDKVEQEATFNIALGVPQQSTSYGIWAQKIVSDSCTGLFALSHDIQTWTLVIDENGSPFIE